MKRVFLVAAALVAVIAWWMVREEGGGRVARGTDSPRDNPTAERDVQRQSDGSTGPSIPDRPTDPERVLLAGKVTGPDGPLWGVRIRIHPHGEVVAFDETRTRTDGTYSIEFAVAGAGESIDISAHPEDGSETMGERIESIEAKRGTAIERDFFLSAGGVIEGIVLGLSPSPFSRDIPTLALVPLAGWEAKVAEAGGGYPRGALPSPVSRAKGASRFRFKQVPPGRYVVVAEDERYIVLDPPIVEAGAKDVRVRLTRAPRIWFSVFDAQTADRIPRVQVGLMGHDAGAPFSVVKGPDRAARFDGRLLMPARPDGKPWRVRVSAPGYHDLVRDIGVDVGPSRERVYSLVPDSAPQVTLRFTGTGAASLGEGLTLYIAREFTAGQGRAMRLKLYVQLPELDRGPRHMTFAILPGDWNVALQRPDAMLGGANTFPLKISERGEMEVHLSVPDPARLEVDMSGIREGPYSTLALYGAPVEWVEHQRNSYRLERGGGESRAVLLRRSLFVDPTPPQTYLAFPGEWTVNRAVGQTHRASFAVTLAEGEHSRLVIDR